MIVSGQAKHFYSGRATFLRGSDEGEKRLGDDRSDDTIPLRYRKEWGGIDLEQVQLDQQEARRQVVRAIIRSLGKWWREA